MALPLHLDNTTQIHNTRNTHTHTGHHIYTCRSQPNSFSDHDSLSLLNYHLTILARTQTTFTHADTQNQTGQLWPLPATAANCTTLLLFGTASTALLNRWSIVSRPGATSAPLWLFSSCTLSVCFVLTDRILTLSCNTVRSTNPCSWSALVAQLIEVILHNISSILELTFSQPLIFFWRQAFPLHIV